MDRKNTVLLTVIAVATLLVAVIGATFAYFTAQRGDGAQADITVTTSTSDSIVYGNFEPLLLKATQQNFASEAGSLQASTEGKITLTASDNADRSDTADYCYTSTIKISQNDFVYKPAEDSEEPDSVPAAKQPELILSVWKNNQEYSAEKIQDMSYQSLESTYKVCKEENGEVVEENGCQDAQTIAGYDITEVGKNSTPEIPDPSTVNVRIPVMDSEKGELQDGNDLLYVHHIKATETGGTTEVTWKAAITFVNYDFDQQYNTNKKFIATWVFTPVECATGDPINSDGEP